MWAKIQEVGKRVQRGTTKWAERQELTWQFTTPVNIILKSQRRRNTKRKLKVHQVKFYLHLKQIKTNLRTIMFTYHSTQTLVAQFKLNLVFKNQYSKGLTAKRKKTGLLMTWMTWSSWLFATTWIISENLIKQMILTI